VPWRGPEYAGEFPTLGYLVGEWMEEYLIVPDRAARGRPFRLTDEQWRHILWTYRLKPAARPEMGSSSFTYYGSLLVRPQKAGKDPLGAAQCCVQGLGPVRFAGWDAYGEPVGMPMPTAWIQCAANSEDQVDNTFRPIFTMLSEGPLCDLPGLDVGLTRVNLPDGGRIEPVTAQARSRLGARITYATFTESGLYTEGSGGVSLARTMKRGLAGMDGRWMELTNAWDPSENSTAQQTFNSKAPGVFIDYRPPRVHVDFEDDAQCREELAYVYGDSAVEQGGWVNLERILEEARDAATGEGEARRFFFNEVTVGSKDAVDPLLWESQARPGEQLEKYERICLGFHGSQNRDGTSLVACRMRDGMLFHLRTWERPAHLGDEEWKVPRDEVMEHVKLACETYELVSFFCSPHLWQTEVNTWAGEYPKRVYEIWLNSEMRIDQVVERFETAHHGNEITWDGSEELRVHAKAAALAKGKKRSTAEELTPGQSEHYQRVVRKGRQSVSAFQAALLAYEARGWAIEHGELLVGAPNLW
jgi:hypothetical protein